MLRKYFNKKISKNVYKVIVKNKTHNNSMEFFGTIPMILKQVIGYDIIENDERFIYQKHSKMKYLNNGERIDLLNFLVNGSTMDTLDGYNEAKVVKLFSGKKYSIRRLIDYIESLKYCERD
jgi:hypothetical protein